MEIKVVARKKLGGRINNITGSATRRSREALNCRAGAKRRRSRN